MKFKRSQRLVDMTMYISQHPHEKIAYPFFADRYQVAKSSLSEDVAILKETFQSQGLGLIETITGASGGVVYKPACTKQKEEEMIDYIMDLAQDESRILAGGYLYLSDLIGDPLVLRYSAKIIAGRMKNQPVDYVLTLATKGISLATAIALELNCPVLYARKDSKVTEGPTVSINYTSESAPHLVQSMEIAQTALEPESQVLLVDDFLRGGGSFAGLQALLDIFSCQPAGKFVLCENIKADQTQLTDSDIQSLLAVTGLDQDASHLTVNKGSLFDKNEQ